MAIEKINSLNVMLLDEIGPRLGSEQDALDVIGATYGLDVDAVAIPVSRFAPDFFVLGNKQAGHFIQKLQNYSLRLIILGDLTEAMANSKALTDFVGETNRIGHHFFAGDRAAMEAGFGRTR
ncbi:hypothetical protein ASD83_08295 [Devosia sp. Root685]|uniref:DUF4180 domain-containing protein n=1 Tax=Devosia sp. Root685 TaxID=1736587 RepID=UPI0006F65F91|nr:DUF4180 domain-containing protein [Devosia sp. Root685]KRB01485.1 hypothetical protein ASD83_08295 [Devosia sp. Root685]